jgi:hypothetical protein
MPLGLTDKAGLGYTVAFLNAAGKTFLDLRIWVPSLSMNVATLTRGNRFFEHPNGGSSLSDRKRSNLLKNVRIRFRDVSYQQPIGHLAIGNDICLAQRTSTFKPVANNYRCEGLYEDAG